MLQPMHAAPPPKPTPAPATWQAWCDGSARPNPGPIGLGAVLIAPDGQAHQLSERSPQPGCNNEAEARALLATLELALRLGAQNIQVFSDSDVVVRLSQNPQLTEAARLAPIFEQIHARLAEFHAISLHWLPQRRNTRADALARQALNLPERPIPKARKKR